MSTSLKRKGVTGLGILGIAVVAVLAAGLATTGLVTDSSPTITNASVYPKKVKDGDVLLIRAEVENAQEVTANIEHEKGFDVKELTLKKENTYEGSWVAHDLKNQAWYNVTLNASNAHGSSLVKVPFQDPTVSHPASQITAGTFDSGDFTFPNNLDVQGKVKENGYDLLPRGVITMWSGNLSEIPDGWALCNGSTYTAPNGDSVTTPNLTDKFIYGVSNGEDPGATGGNTTHQHKSPVALDGGTGSSGMRVGDDDGTNSNLWGSESGPSMNGKCDEVNQMCTTSIWALNSPESNIPPYYKLAYIMKL